MNDESECSPFISGSIDTPQDALLFCDYLAKFGVGYTGHFRGLATVIRTLMRRLEDQAVAFERSEAIKQ